MNGRRWGIMAGMAIVLTGLLLTWRRSDAPPEPDFAPKPSAAPIATPNLDLGPASRSAHTGPSVARTDAPEPEMSGSVSGRVYDADAGDGLNNVEVTASRPERDPTAKTITDGEGRYRLAGLAKGNWRIGAGNAGMPRAEQYVSLRAGQERDGVDFALPMGLSISGTVTEPNGAPAEGARVWAEFGHASAGSTCDASGVFRIFGLPAGAELTVRASKPAFGESDTVQVTLGDRPRQGLRLALHREASISGVVVNESGDPVAGASVHFGGGRPRVSRPTDGDGVFHLSGLRPGRYELFAHQISWSGGSIRLADDPPQAVVELREGEHKQGVQVVIPDDGYRRGSVSGIVMDRSGRPLEGADVHLGREMMMVQTEADGAFTVHGLREPAVHGGHVRLEGYRLLRISELAVPSANHEFVLDPLARIRGRVVDARTGEPLTRFSVAHIDHHYGDVLPHLLEFVPHYDPKGAFVLPADRKGFVVVAPGYAWTVHPLREAPETDIDVEVRLEPGATLIGTVVDAGGTPLAGAQVFLETAPEGFLDPTRGAPSHAAAFTDGDGRFWLESLPTSITKIFAYMPGHALGSLEVALQPGENAPVTIRLTEGLFVAGRVFYAGAPVAGANVTLELGEPRPQGSAQVTSNDGSFRFDNLFPGEGQLVVRLPLEGDGMYDVRSPIMVEYGRTVERDVHLAPEETMIEGHISGTSEEARKIYVEASTTANGATHRCTGVAEGDTYRLYGIPAGSVELSARVSYPAGSERRTAETTLVAGHAVRVDFDFSNMIRVTGAVTGLPRSYQARGVVVPGARATPASVEAFVAFLEQEGRVAEVYIQDGQFFFTLDEPGAYTLLIGAANRAETDIRFTSVSFEAATGETVFLSPSL